MPVPSFRVPDTGTPAERVISFVLDEGLCRRHRLRIDLSDPDERITPDGCAGKPASLALPARDGGQEFRGLVTAVTPYSSRDDHSLCRVEVRDRFSALAPYRASRVFEAPKGKSLKQIAQEILTPAGVTAEIDGDEPKYPSRVQYHESDYRFLRCLFLEAGCHYFARGDTLVVCEDVAKKPRDSIEAAFLGDVQAFRVRNVTRSVKTTRITQRYDRDKDEENSLVVPSEAGGGSVGAKAGAAAHKSQADVAFVEVVNQTLLQRHADTASRAAGSATAVGRGRSTLAAVRPGVVLTLHGAPRAGLDGEYLVTRVVHRYHSPRGRAKGAEYHNDFWCVPADARYQPPGRARRPVVGGVHIGFVVAPTNDQNKDPLGLGRVRVRLPWMGQSKPCQGFSCWARVLQLDAGKGHGTLFLPDVGDEVLVGFEGGNPDAPVVLGGLYAKGRPPEPAPTPKNTHKLIRTRSGNVILLEDVDEKTCRLSIYQGKADSPNNLVRLEGGEKAALEINSRGDIHVVGKGDGEILFKQGDGSIRITAKGDVEITGGQVLIKANKKVAAEGGDSVSLKGGRVLIN